ncbi:MAG: TonB-dependent receptor [Lautropia sp.]|nr:TonB-dependent receptor [Lautropia sp.]
MTRITSGSRRLPTLLPATFAPALLCAAIGNAWAQDNTRIPQATTLPNIVVTATGTEVEVKDAPASISVISREQIESKPVTSVGALLRDIPGVTGGLAGDGAQAKIKLRGLPDKYTLILIDGKRQGNSAGVNYRDDLGPQDLDWVSPEVIERIEVVRGPMSSLYGSEAMGGVINIITRKTGAKWGGSVTTSYSRPQDSDRGDRKQISFNLSGPLSERLGLRIGGNYNYRSADEGVDGFTEEYQATAGSRNLSLDALLDWRLTDEQTLSVDVKRGVRRAINSKATHVNRWGNVAPVVPAWGLDKLEQTGYGITHTGRFDNTNTRLSAYTTRYESTGADVEYAAAGNNSKEHIVEGQVDTPITLGAPQVITGGFQWKRESLQNADTIGQIALDYNGNPVSTNKLSASTWALFAEDQIFLRDNLTATLGLRMDHHEKYGSHWVPRGYLVYKPAEGWTLKGGVSRGFRAPNLKENSPSAATFSGGNGCRGLVNNPNFVDDQGRRYRTGGCYMAGNPDLKPETSTNVEIGGDWSHNGWEAGLTYFHTNFKNRIGYRPLGFRQGQWWTMQTNAERARTRGIEANLTVPLPAGITWRTNATRMLQAENLDTRQALIDTPKLSLGSTLDWDISDRWNASLSAQYTGRQLQADSRGNASTFVSAYTTIDIATSYTLNQTFTVRGGVTNLTDKQSREAGNNYDDGGRTFFMGLTARF